MKDNLRNKCDLFADNYSELGKSFKWNDTINNRLGALLYSLENRIVDTDAINRCRKIIKENTGVFSQFKDTINFMISVLLSLQAEPEAILKGSIGVYDGMKKEGFHSSPYLVLSAVQIALQADPYNYQRITIASKNFYDAMKEEHRFLTSSDDYGFATLLAMSNKPVTQAVLEMESCYQLLKDDFSQLNAVQTLSHILTFSDESAANKCRRVVDLHRSLKSRKCKINSNTTLSFLGVIALLKEDTDKLVDEIVETKEYLKSKKGFGAWSIEPRERIMYAIAIVCSNYLEEAKKNMLEMALERNIAGIMLAQQMATMAAISGASAAAAASAASAASN